jgi:hypothetical protein
MILSPPAADGFGRLGIPLSLDIKYLHIETYGDVET